MDANEVRQKFLWWQHGIIYQVYPRSFMDSNGDGIGDLRGITSRLDYLQWLGIDAVWISPIYPSPMADFGYDVSNYVDIHPIFGSLADFDVLRDSIHQRGMKLILDFVPNHTSDEHPWFVESRSSRNNPKRNWYIWRDPGPNGGAPNNWQSVFGGSAWELDPGTGQYYYHAFLKKQPDLNWRNPEVQDAMLNVMRFWLDRGVDGFRVDVIYHIIKDEQFRDNPPNPDFREEMSPYRTYLSTYTTDRPEVHQIIAKMRALLDSYQERMMVGEIYLPVERLVTYYGAGGEGTHLPFNFQLVRLPWSAATIAEAVNVYEAKLPSHGWPNWVLGNHDKHRVASRVGRAQARVAAMLLLTLRGTPTVYYGDELGMCDVPIPPAMVQDPYEKQVPGLGLGRDPCRTPMQWDAGPNAGFTIGRPWLPLSGDYADINVERERQDPKGMLALCRRLIELRRSEPALMVGPYSPLPVVGHVMAYVRVQADRGFLIALNMGSEPAGYSPLPAPGGRVLLSTHLDREGEEVTGAVLLRENEGVILAV